MPSLNAIKGEAERARIRSSDAEVKRLAVVVVELCSMLEKVEKTADEALKLAKKGGGLR